MDLLVWMHFVDSVRFGLVVGQNQHRNRKRLFPKIKTDTETENTMVWFRCDSVFGSVRFSV
jgi:hypothetical protein